MRPLVALAFLAPALLAGCAEDAPASGHVVPFLRLDVRVAGDTTFEIGEVLGSESGTLIQGFRVEDDTKRIVVKDPVAFSHVVLVNRSDGPPVLVADATRALAGPRETERPSIVEFEVEDDAFAFTVVQPGQCKAYVNNRGVVTNSTGPFEVPPLRALPAGSREYLVFALTGEGGPDCAAVRVEANNLGRWTVVGLSDA